MQTILVTGSNGLIGSAVARHFHGLGWTVHGLDNDARAMFLGASASTRPMQRVLESELDRFTHHELDIRDRDGVLRLVGAVKPDAIVHAAGQPSHDRAAQIVFDDFDTNAVGTLNLLEAARLHAPESPFVFMSTNKVYGDGVNRLELRECGSGASRRLEFAHEAYADGIDEEFPVDQCTHSLMGASKLAADVLVQEYGRYFGMKTCCLRCGCLTGGAQAGVEAHGFLSHLTRCAVAQVRERSALRQGSGPSASGSRLPASGTSSASRGTPAVSEAGSRKPEAGRSTYRVLGHEGKQVRDNMHASDVARFIARFIDSPRAGAVYNIGGGKPNSCSILEAFAMVEKLTGTPMEYEMVDEPRMGDHVCYYTDLSKAKRDYPGWDVTVSLDEIVVELVESWR